MRADGAPQDGVTDARTVLDALRDYAVLQLSPAGEVQWASAGVAILLGEAPQALAGVSFPDLFAGPKGRQGLAARLRKAIRETGVFREELATGGDGERRWIGVEAYPADPAEPGGQIVAICRDVTAEHVQRVADERFRKFTEAVHDYAVCLLSPGGVITDWNAGAARLTGFEAADVVGRHFSCFYDEEDRAAGAPASTLEEARRAGASESEGWRVRADGGRFWAWMVLDRLADEAGEALGFALTIRDITERQVAQEALRQSEQQFRLLVNGVHDQALYMLDPNGIIVSWNSGAQRIKGYKADEVIGRHYSMFYTETDRAAGKPAQSLYAAMSTGRFETDGWRVRKDGTLFWANVLINAIRGGKGELVGFAKITRDATERRRAQAELAKTQERLFHAQKLEALGHLTGGIAHDFNNLLMVMGGQARKLKKDATRPDAVARAAQTIEAASERGAALTRQLLSFARRQSLSRSTISLPERIAEFHALIARSLGAGVRLDVKLAPDLWPVEADVNELEVAMINLAVNARDAMPDGGTLTISAENVVLKAGDVEADLAGEFVALRFADTGVGMPPDVLFPAQWDPKLGIHVT